MRNAEWIHLVVFPFLMVLALTMRLPLARRLRALLTGAVGLAVTLVCTRLPEVLPPLAASVVRDWAPAPLMLLVYWQAGQFFVKIQEGFQQKLARMDEWLVAPLLLALQRRKGGRRILGYLEVAYLFCYPMIPFSVATIYLLRMGSETDRYWSTVLPPTYLCYVMVPFAQMLPPRSIDERWRGGLAGGSVKDLNLLILRNASIHANTFPSAHVAASISSGLALMRLDPWVGAVFLWVGVSIAFGAVLGRYHYAADAILGAAAAVLTFALT